MWLLVLQLSIGEEEVEARADFLWTRATDYSPSSLKLDYFGAAGVTCL